MKNFAQVMAGLLFGSAGAQHTYPKSGQVAPPFLTAILNEGNHLEPTFK